jgi:hypothetical protein
MVILFFLLARAPDPLLPDYKDTWFLRSLGSLMIIPSLSMLLFTSNKRVHYGVLFFNLFLLFWSSYTLNVRNL